MEHGAAPTDLTQNAQPSSSWSSGSQPELLAALKQLELVLASRKTQLARMKENLDSIIKEKKDLP
ncbi:hypothetical protein RvY_14236 [Ramazzottius varieornatus]|uniref:Uncharacterized protein n=1 Tax=Ramazzottius varieornatus TaxID=947166 RepID=A0A1D1VQL2_RAMVA|nr:hypothetical protein RvY_14236 [Ramazzottius varieornatus]